MKVPKLLELLVAGAPEGWRFGAASFLGIESARLEGTRWTLTRALHVANGFRTSWDLHPREEIEFETRNRLVSGPFHTLFHAFQRAGYEARVLDAPPVVILGFHRPQKTMAEAQDEIGVLAEASLADVLATGQVPGLKRRKAREPAYVAPEQCLAAVDEMVRASESAVFTLNALLETPGDDGWFLLAHATAARGKTSVGAVLTLDPGDPSGSEFESLPAPKRRRVSAAFTARGYERDENGWFSRDLAAREILNELQWLARAEVVRG